MNTIIFSALCALMIFLPLPFGSVEEWAIFVFEAMTLALFGLHIAGHWSKAKRNREEKFKTPRILKIFLAVFFAVTLFQLTPFPPSILKILSPQTAAIYHNLGLAGWRTLSLTPNLTVYELLKYICYFLFGLLVFRYVRSRREIEIFVWTMMAGAIFQSFYGLEEYFGGTHRIWGWKNIFNLDSAFGTFVNRNHFAGFLEMLLPLSIGYLLAKANFLSLRKGLTFKEKILWFGQERLQKTIIYSIAPIIIGIGLAFSRSRTGVFLFLVSIFLMTIAISAAGKKNIGPSAIPQKRFGKIIRTVALVIIFAVLFIGINPIIERFSPEIITGKSRLTIYKYTLDLINNFLLFGTGPGTYVFAYPKFEKVQTPGLADHAHNDYLELLAESGALGGGCLILLAFGALVVVFARWTRRSDYFIKGIALGCFCGIATILLHSITDFNLRLPANAVYFTALYALAMSAVSLRRA